MFQRLSFEDGDFRAVDSTSPDLRVAVVPVIVRDERGVRGLGSAFCIATLASGKALYVTARHVVSDALPEPIPEGYTRVSLSGRELFLLLPGGLGSIAEANALRGVLIEDISLAPNHSDIALVTVDISDFGYPPTAAAVFRLALSRPVIGQKCCALGYADMASGQPVAGDPNTSGWQGPLQASQATIEEIHPSRRDGAMLTFPCFRTGAFYAPGMSGGPISSVDGRILGVVSTSFDDGGTAYGSLMAGLLEAKVRLPTDQGNLINLSFPDLIANALVDTDGAEVTLDRSGDRVSLTWADPE